MLHTRAQAHRSAALLLSVTLDTLPKRKPFYRYEVAPGRWLIVVRDDIEYGHLSRSYARRLPDWARTRMFGPIGVADPAGDLEAHRRTRWWEPDWPVSTVSVHLLEDAAPGITPWPHEWLLDPPA